ncbi:MAG: DedA family protein [Deltaproteobacteria bacterium]|jgi:membrane protein DedA with SNARE-associated domain
MEYVRPFLLEYGYWAVFAAILLEDFGLPLPGETLLITGSILAAQGDMHIVPLLLFAWAGAVLGDTIGYGLGRFAGRRLVLRYGRYVLITPHRLDHARTLFRKHGGMIVVVARFFEVLRQLNGIVAGTVDMPWWRFVSYNMLGAVLWVCFWGILFFEAGDRAKAILGSFNKLEVFMIIGLVIAGIIVVFFVLRRSLETNRTGK